MSVSRSRKPSPCAARNLLIYGDGVAKLCHCLQFPSFLSFLNFLERQVSSYLRPELHLLAILENPTLRLDCVLWRQVSLYLTNLLDKVLWVSPGFSTQSDSAQSKNLSRQVRPGSSSSALTLPRYCCLLFCSCILFAIKLEQMVRCLRYKSGGLRRAGVIRGIRPFNCCMVFMILVRRSLHAFPHGFIGFNYATVFCVALLFNATGFPVLLTLSFAKHCGWHRNLNSLRVCFMISMNSSSSGSMKKIPRNLLAFPSFGFSIAHFCFSLMRWTNSSTYLAYIVWP